MKEQDIREMIEKRINDATPGTSKYNFWPTGLEVIKTTEFDLSNPEQAYTAGQLMGRENYAYRQIHPENIPYPLPPNHWLVSTKFILGYAKGQGDDVKTRNLHAVFESSKNPRKYPRELTVVVIEIGCKHDYEVRSPYNCYSEGKCKKCGHTWSRDSSG